MTNLEQRAHDLAIASIDVSQEMSSQDVFEKYQKRYFELYDYFNQDE